MIRDKFWILMNTIRLVEDGRFSLTNIALIVTLALLRHPHWPNVAAFCLALSAYYGKKLIFNYFEQPKLNKPDDVSTLRKEVDSLRAAVALGTVRR